MNRRVQLVLELQETISTIESGFELLQRDDSWCFREVPCARLLSDGLERYLKVTLHLINYAKTGQFLADKALRNFGHRIDALWEQVRDKGFDERALSNEFMVARELNFVANDPILLRIIEVIALYADASGEYSRYARLNAVASQFSAQFPDAVDQGWDDIIKRVMQIQSVKEYTDQSWRDIIAPTIIGRIERFLRLVARAIYFSDRSREVRSIGSPMMHFLTIKDDDLGGRVYPCFGRS